MRLVAPPSSQFSDRSLSLSLSLAVRSGQHLPQLRWGMRKDPMGLLMGLFAGVRGSVLLLTVLTHPRSILLKPQMSETSFLEEAFVKLLEFRFNHLNHKSLHPTAKMIQVMHQSPEPFEVATASTGTTKSAAPPSHQPPFQPPRNIWKKNMKT